MNISTYQKREKKKKKENLLRSQIKLGKKLIMMG